ncbi:ABC transporter ATP-binding protein [Bacillus sp. MUM 13]|uniref:ABC transporter ATP-binding protein n=1 Tax=Bacillus sp. MUM 13 TaxID=1678001 RepID=UPI0008F5DCEB|nr:ABC transporter ATP-binding protein [Bacillus sp. MUM 13]OIK10043.1 spermidine/putrescine ABC transporter ATP-binding protein [Bacillus sp. MUM 13]
MGFLSIQNIHHTYFSKTAAFTALDGICLEIEEGEFISFLGPSGCGKTTLLSIIAGLFSPTAGKVMLGESQLHGGTENSIGYMLQSDYLFPWKTIEENVVLGLKLRNENGEAARNKGLKLLQDVGLEDVQGQFPKQLSGGMRQRAALARTLAVDPKILLLDEPFSALDYQTKLKLEDLVFETLKSFQKTAILVTHDIGESIAMSDRIFMFSANPGRLHATFAVPEEIRGLTPFQTRSHPIYQELFQTIWKELEGLENISKR